MKKRVVLLIIVSLFFILLFTDVKTICGEVSPSPEVQEDERFYVYHTFWAFGGFYPICTFNANTGDYLKLNMSSVNADPNHPDDAYEVDLEITSANHGTTYVSGTWFSQSILLNYTDTYNITASKHPFWSSVRINGSIVVQHLTVSSEDKASSSSIPPLNPTLEPTSFPSDSTGMANQSSSAPELSWLAILPLFAAILTTALILKHLRVKKP